MINKIKDNVLFDGLTTKEIEQVITNSNARVKEYKKHEIIFSQLDPPKALYLLLEGKVSVSQDSLEGRTYVICQIDENDIFGEVFLFLHDVGYSQYVVANVDSKVLEIPKDYFVHTTDELLNASQSPSAIEATIAHGKIISNMLSILAKKAFYLNTKVQLLTSGNLRQRLAKYLFTNMNDKGIVKLSMNRDSLSAYLNVTRPSLSRELMKMQEEGLIISDKEKITILNFDELEEYLVL